MAYLSLICVLMAFVVQAQRLESLVVNHQVYSNVVIQSKTATHLFFNHDRGFSSVKMTDLPSVSRKQLGYEAEDPAQAPSASSMDTVAQMAPQLWEKTVAMSQPLQEIVLPVFMKMLWLIVALFILGFLVASFCFMLICHKAGQPPGISVWIPVLQLFPLLKAANMSPWNFLLFILPFFNVLASLIWCVKICKVLHKSPWLGVLLFFPLTSIFLLLYLAFSNCDDPNEPQVIKLDYPEAVAE